VLIKPFCHVWAALGFTLSLVSVGKGYLTRGGVQEVTKERGNPKLTRGKRNGKKLPNIA